jgi:hypothetical protein
MNIGELKVLIKDIPDDVEVYREADHGQVAEQSPGFRITDASELLYYAEDIDWQDEGTIPLDKITAVVIG